MNPRRVTSVSLNSLTFRRVIMHPLANPTRLAMITFCAGIAAGYFLFSSREDSTVVTMAQAQTAVSSAATLWEYSTSSIDLPSLQSKLTTMGIDGWEVISVTATDATLDQGTDGKMHVSSQRVEVTAKRKKR